MIFFILVLVLYQSAHSLLRTSKGTCIRTVSSDPSRIFTSKYGHIICRFGLAQRLKNLFMFNSAEPKISTAYKTQNSEL